MRTYKYLQTSQSLCLQLALISYRFINLKLARALGWMNLIESWRLESPSSAICCSTHATGLQKSTAGLACFPGGSLGGVQT